jgi:hypothetical protein
MSVAKFLLCSGAGLTTIVMLLYWGPVDGGEGQEPHLPALTAPSGAAVAGIKEWALPSEDIQEATPLRSSPAPSANLNGRADSEAERPELTKVELEIRDWEISFAGLDSRALTEIKKDLMNGLSRDMNAIGSRLLDDPAMGVRLDGPPGMEPEGEVMFTTRIMAGGTEFYRVYMEERDYPDLYAKRREIKWLNQRAHMIDKEARVAARRAMEK